MTDPDRVLALSARRGDHRSLACLYDRHRTRLFGLLVRLVGSRPAAEDLFQEVWIKVMHGIEHYRPEGGTFRAWLFRIASNAAVDRRRRERRHMAEELDAPLADDDRSRLDLLPSHLPSPLRLAEAAEIGTGVEQALQDLSEQQRSAVLLRHQQGLSYTEIAAALDVPEGTAKTMVFRGVRMLRDRLRSSGAFAPRGGPADQTRPGKGE